MNETGIEWTDVTWNPVHGCSKVSEGCRNCYAERLSRRYDHTPAPWTPENAEQNVQLKPHKLEEPFGIGEPSRVFVNSMSDLFHEQVPDKYVQEVLAVCRSLPQHVFQVLTKRPERAAAFDRVPWPQNIWVGTSVENKRAVDRIDQLRACDANTLFVSFEPLIGPVGTVDLNGIEWAIVGGESGPEDQRRRFRHAWAREIRDQCAEQDVAFFFKQSAGPHPGTNPALVERDLTRTEYHEQPELPQVTVDARKEAT